MAAGQVGSQHIPMAVLLMLSQSGAISNWPRAVQSAHVGEHLLLKCTAACTAIDCLTLHKMTMLTASTVLTNLCVLTNLSARCQVLRLQAVAPECFDLFCSKKKSYRTEVGDKISEHSKSVPSEWSEHSPTSLPASSFPWPSIQP